jgi:hypothetical protein
MISVRQLASSLYGVWLLLRWDSAGFGFFERDFRGFVRSYLVAIALAPVYVAHAIAVFDPARTGGPFASYLTTEIIAYVMSWSVFPFAMIYIARILDRDRRYFDYLVPYNWFQLAVGLVTLPINLLADVGLLTGDAAGFLNLVVLCAFMSYAAFLAHHGLDVPWLTSAGVVTLDIVLSLVVRQVVGLV